jgi:hypothetical protein
MTIRFTGAMFGGILLVLATTTGSFAQAGGFTPSASASSQEIAEHQATIRAEMLYAKCKQQYGVWPEVLSVRAPNSLTAACMRNGGRKI